MTEFSVIIASSIFEIYKHLLCVSNSLFKVVDLSKFGLRQK